MTPPASTGRFSADGRWLALAGDGLESGISLVDTASGAVSTADLPDGRYPYGTAVDLLAWTGESQLLAALRAGTGPTTLGSAADLALLTLPPGYADPSLAAARRLDVDVVGRVEIGQTESVVSVATDLLSAASPTRDFDPPPFAPSDGTSDGSGDRGDRQPGGRGAAALLVLLLAAPAIATCPSARASAQPGPALPATVYGVSGTGGLPIEPDLAVGASSVAVANSAGVFVVTAQDGDYHRLRLPGDHAPGLTDSGVPGVALSPDGNRLAYAWHARVTPGDAAVPSGVRVLDLVTGACPDRPGPRHPAGRRHRSPGSSGLEPPLGSLAAATSPTR